MCCNNVVLPSVWNENVKCYEKYCDESDYEREKELECFKLNRSYKELIESLNINIMVNNVDLPCTVVNNVYIEDKHLSVGRVNVLVVTDNCDDVTYLGVTTETYGDLTKNNNVDLVYDKIIMGGNPMYYYYGTMEHINLYGYYTNDSHMMCINKIEKCYKKIRLLYDDGG